MKSAIVTGANGFVGSAVVRELVANGVSVAAMDLPSNNDKIPQNNLVEFTGFDLSASEKIPALLNGQKFDAFFHFAWAGSAGAARADTRLQLDNAQWTIDCLRAAKEVSCKRFICAGSIMEHETIAAAYTQGNHPGTGYIYGSGKLVAHTMSMSVAAELGIDLIWAKITNAYGAGEVSPRFVNSTIRKILKDQPLEFTSGVQNYDFIYIDDVARAFYLIGDRGKAFHHYLIGSGHPKQLKDFILEMKQSIAPDKDFIFGNVPFTGTNLSLEEFNTSTTENDTGFCAKISFAEGVKRTMEWIKEYDSKMGL